MAKRAIHLQSVDGVGLPLLRRLGQDGHPITMAVTAHEARKVGRGLVPHTRTPPRGALILMDAVGQDGAALRKSGHLVIGGNAVEAQLETDRGAGLRLMREVEIAVPPTHPCVTVAEAIAVLTREPGRWFVKLSGESVESSTYDAPDSDSMIRYLRFVEAAGPVAPFVLQRAVAGTEVSCEGWFDGQDFVLPFDLTIEEKRFLAGEHGPRTGCESCVVWHARDEALASRGVARIGPVLARAGYVGPIDLNSIVTTDGTLVGLEWTARLGFDATQAWMRLFDETLGEQLEAFADGDLDEWEPRRDSDLSATLRVSIPPYPTWHVPLIAKTAGTPLPRGLERDPFVDLVDVEKTADGLSAAGASAVVATVAAVGSRLAPLRADLLTRAGAHDIPNAQYRIDPVSRADRAMAELDRLHLVGREARPPVGVLAPAR